MTSIEQAFPVPAIYLNNYLWSAMTSIDDSLSAQYTYRPFFPLADSRAGDQGWGDKTYVVYDHMMKFRSDKFYGVHKAQTFYWIRGTASSSLAWTAAISHILDREDVSAQAVNAYTAENDPTAGIYFHGLKVFQVDTANEERMDLSVRQMYTSSMIIESKYHITRDNGFN